MNNYVPLLLAILASVILLGCQDKDVYAEPQNLLLGVSFEEQSNEFFYYSASSQNFNFEWSKEEAFDGEQSLKIEGVKSGNDFAFWSIRFYDFEMDKPFKARIRVKTKDITGEGFAFNMFSRSEDLSNSVGSATYQNRTTDGEWITVETELNPNPSEEVLYVDLYMLMLKFTTGTVYFDKLEIFTEE